jgi:multiple sugar transport system permease protein
MRSKRAPIQHIHPIKPRLKRLAVRAFQYLLCTLISIALLAPIAWLLICSITPRTELASKPPHWLPKKPVLDTYQVLLFGKKSTAIDVGPNFLLALRNNVLICSGSALLAMALGIPSGYGMSRFRFKGRDTLRLAIVGIRMVPFGSMVIPFYLILTKVHLFDTQLGLILVYQSFTLPFVIWLMSNFFDSLPVELEEAARVEGANTFTVLRRIAIPLSLPGVATTAILSFMISWDELFYALILTNSYRAKNLSVAISELSTRYTIDFSLWITGGVIGLLVPFILALFFQRYIISGLTMGALKG